MNKAQSRVVRFVGTGAVVGIVVGILVGMIMPSGIGKAELALTFSIFGVICGAIAAWFTGLR